MKVNQDTQRKRLYNKTHYRKYEIFVPKEVGARYDALCQAEGLSLCEWLKIGIALALMGIAPARAAAFLADYGPIFRTVEKKPAEVFRDTYRRDKIRIFLEEPPARP